MLQTTIGGGRRGEDYKGILSANRDEVVVSMAKKSVAELRTLCRELRIKLSGRKGEIVLRILVYWFGQEVGAELFGQVEKRMRKRRRKSETVVDLSRNGPIKVRLPKWQPHRRSFCFCNTSCDDYTPSFVRKCRMCRRRMHLNCVQGYIEGDAVNQRSHTIICPSCLVTRDGGYFSYTEYVLARPLVTGGKTISANSSEKTTFLIRNAASYLSNTCKSRRENGRIVLTCVDLSEGFEKPCFRWPHFFKVRVNDRDFRTSRLFAQGSAKMSDVTDLCKDGRNELFFECGIPHFHFTEGPFVLVVHIVKDRTVRGVVDNIRRASTITSNVGRACMLRKLRKEEEEDGVIAMQAPRVSLRCPLSLRVMNCPARGKLCKHTSCFDLESYLAFNASIRNPQTKSKWKCPVCSAIVKPAGVICSGYVQEMVDAIEHVDREDIEWAEISSDASWSLCRPKGSASSGGSTDNGEKTSKDSGNASNERAIDEKLDIPSRTPIVQGESVDASEARTSVQPICRAAAAMSDPDTELFSIEPIPIYAPAGTAENPIVL